MLKLLKLLDKSQEFKIIFKACISNFVYKIFLSWQHLIFMKMLNQDNQYYKLLLFYLIKPTYVNTHAAVRCRQTIVRIIIVCILLKLKNCMIAVISTYKGNQRTWEEVWEKQLGLVRFRGGKGRRREGYEVAWWRSWWREDDLDSGESMITLVGGGLEGWVEEVGYMKIWRWGEPPTLVSRGYIVSHAKSGVFLKIDHFHL